jgi:hypothetical protein
MYKLTERRLAKAVDILNAAAADLANKKHINTSTLEMQLRDCWDLGYQELKDIFCQMLKMDEYQNLAAFYMQFSNTTGVVSEFQMPLCDFYGIDQVPRDISFQQFWKLLTARSENKE